MKVILSHFSHEDFIYDAIRSYNQLPDMCNFKNNPNGLCLSSGDEWLDYCKSNDTYSALDYKFKSSFEVDLDQMLMCRNYLELENIERYFGDNNGIYASNMPTNLRKKLHFIDWAFISNFTTFKGIYIKSFMSQYLSNMKLWLQDYPVDTLIAWNLSALKYLGTTKIYD